MAASLLVFLMSFSTPADGQGKKNGGGQGKPNAVIASFAYCADSDFACKSANGVRMDINAPYVDGQNGVDAWFNVDVSGDLLINLINSSRAVTYDFSQVVNFGSPHPDWWYSAPVQTVSPHFNIGNAWAALEQCGGAPVCDEHYITRMNGGAWDTGRNTPNNRLQWNPFSAQPFINTPDETSAVDVHYIKTATDEVFIITPIANAGGYFLAGLQAEMRRSVTASGQYNMPFRLEVRLK